MKPTGTITAKPNPIVPPEGALAGRTTLSWTSEGAESVEVHVGSPSGPLFSRQTESGSATTGDWVSDGMTFYLQDVSDGKPLSSENTLSEVRVTVTGQDRPNPPPGSIRFGSFRRLTPISRQWGWDRGRPIDRYYIEKFLADHSEDIRGHVLEIGDADYTRRFGGGRVTSSDVLNLHAGVPGITIVGDLSRAPHIDSEVFDCIILTQTLQYVYDFRAAVRTLDRILKPSGVVLASVPGISQTADAQWGEYWCWCFTRLSIRRLFEEVFPRTNVNVEAWGNVLAATAFLQGLAVEELSREELDHQDPGYDVTIAVRAAKAQAKQVCGEVDPHP